MTENLDEKARRIETEAKDYRQRIFQTEKEESVDYVNRTLNAYETAARLYHEAGMPVDEERCITRISELKDQFNLCLDEKPSLVPA